jgi:hypothetical protein
MKIIEKILVREEKDCRLMQSKQMSYESPTMDSLNKAMYQVKAWEKKILAEGPNIFSFFVDFTDNTHIEFSNHNELAKWLREFIRQR